MAAEVSLLQTSLRTSQIRQQRLWGLQAHMFYESKYKIWVYSFQRSGKLVYFWTIFVWILHQNYANAHILLWQSLMNQTTSWQMDEPTPFRFTDGRWSLFFNYAQDKLFPFVYNKHIQPKHSILFTLPFQDQVSFECFSVVHSIWSSKTFNVCEMRGVIFFIPWRVLVFTHLEQAQGEQEETNLTRDIITSRGRDDGGVVMETRPIMTGWFCIIRKKKLLRFVAAQRPHTENYKQEQYNVLSLDSHTELEESTPLESHWKRTIVTLTRVHRHKIHTRCRFFKTTSSWSCFSDRKWPMLVDNEKNGCFSSKSLINFLRKTAK